MPHCKFCGTPLDTNDGFYSAGTPDWQGQLKDTPKTFIWVRGLPERCDLRAPVLIRFFVGVSFPSSPAFPLCPATAVR